MSEYKRPAGTYPLSDFHEICIVCTTFQDALAVETWTDLLKRLRSYEGFKLRGSGSPNIHRPLAANYASGPKSFRGTRTCSNVLYHRASLVGLGFHPPPKNVAFFVRLFVCPSRFLIVTVCVPDFAMKELEYRNDFDTVG